MNQLKDLSLWDEDYVAALPTQEFDWLDYKASDKFVDSSWINDMSKYVSAWGNYDGGYIIFGVEDPRSGVPLVIDGGIAEDVKPKLDNWLDDVIPGLVEPSLQKLTTRLIYPKATDSQIKPGHVLIVVHVPESEVAPHQAQDRKYYQRLGRRLEPLRHRAILDIIGRRRHPRLHTTILVHIGSIAEPILFWRVENIGSVMALHWKAVIRFPTQIGSTWVRIDDGNLVCDCTDDGKSFQEMRISKALGSPLFPGSDVSTTFKLKPVHYEPPLEPSIKEVIVTTFADEMPAQKEVFDLSSVLRRH